MFLGKILGTVVATRKSEGMTGSKLYLFQPLNDAREKVGEPMVAVDTVGARENDVVTWVASREASLACDPWFVPVDAAIVGIVDKIGEESL